MTVSDLFPLITITTDFGVHDPYVGIMKGVILRIAPKARLIDLTHTIPQGDVLRGSIVLRSAMRYFPRGTIHLAVIDPGVGGKRNPVAVHTEQQYWVGPDNGLFWFLAGGDPPPQIVKLENRVYHLPDQSQTFHGRDIFAPVAAHMANGIPIREFGSLIRSLKTLSIPAVEQHTPDRLTGSIIYIDHFGNCISNITPDQQDISPISSWHVELDDATVVPLKKYYGQVAEHEPVALIGSSGYLEIAVRNGSAAESLGIMRGTKFALKRGL